MAAPAHPTDCRLPITHQQQLNADLLAFIKS
jgi:hypothetical protein